MVKTAAKTSQTPKPKPATANIGKKMLCVAGKINYHL